MTEIEFCPTYLDDIEIDDKSVIRIFGKTADNKSICVYDDSFLPYFWIIPKADFSIEEIRNQLTDIKIEGSKAFVVNTEVHNKKFLGKKVEAIKVIVNNVKALQKIRLELHLIEGIESKHEIDINFVRKYLVDREITPLTLHKVTGEMTKESLSVDLVIKADKIEQVEQTPLKNPEVLAFDIESYTKNNKYPNEEEDPILMLSFYGNNGYKKVITWKKFETNKDYIEFVENEARLIERFKEIIKVNQPDYLIGYFSDGFDLPYLRIRANRNKVNLNVGLDNSNIKFIRAGDSTRARIVGINHIDIFSFIRNVVGLSLQMEAYDLNSVSQVLLKEGKVDVNVSDIGKAWDANTDLEKYCEYNLRDSELTLKIFLKVLPNLEELVKLVGQQIINVNNMAFSQLVEWYILKNLHRFNEIAKNKPTGSDMDFRSSSYEGAFVYEPKPGLYENVVSFDFRSLYPSIIVAKNICPSTLTNIKEDSYESPLINNKHYYFNYKEDGFIPVLIKELIERRIRIKELIKKGTEVDAALLARDQSLKILANAAYGYYAFFGARWYCKECAASIAAFGRSYIKQTIEKVNKAGYNVIYGDTDSVMFTRNNKNKEEILNFLKELNSGLPSLMELELEDFYKRGIFVMKKSEEVGAKKKYALINENDEIKVIGFETVRRDWSYLAKEVQNNVLGIVLKENSREKAIDYIKKIIDDLRSKKTPIKDLIIRTQLKKRIEDYDAIGPHVEVAKRMQQRGYTVSPGMIIRYVVVEGTGIIRDKARLLEEVKQEEYDDEYYINHQILPSVEKIFEVLGMSKEELLTSKEQSKLGSFA